MFRNKQALLIYTVVGLFLVFSSFLLGQRFSAQIDRLPLNIPGSGKGQAAAQVSIVADFGPSAEVTPSTSPRGKTVVAVNKIRPTPQAPDYEAHLYTLDKSGSPQLLVNFRALDSSIDDLSPALVTWSDTILVPARHVGGDFSLYRVVGNKPTLVFKAPRVSDVYFAGQDAITGAIYFPYNTDSDANAFIIKSTDDGKTWTRVFQGQYEDSTIYHILAYNNRVYVSFKNASTVLRSDDGGKTWSLDFQPTEIPLNMIQVGHKIFLTSQRSIFMREDLNNPNLPWLRYTFPTDSMLIRLPTLVGKYILVNVIRPGISSVWATQDNFLTASPILEIPKAEEYAIRLSGYGSTYYFGAYGLLIKGEVPETLTPLYVSPLTILEPNPLPPNTTTSLEQSGTIEQLTGTGLALTVRATYHAQASSGIRVRVYTSFDGDRERWDTVELKDALGNPVFGNMPFQPDTTQMKTVDIASGSRLLKVTVENQDKTYPVTGIRVVATLRQFRGYEVVPGRAGSPSGLAQPSK